MLKTSLPPTPLSFSVSAPSLSVYICLSKYCHSHPHFLCLDLHVFHPWHSWFLLWKPCQLSFFYSACFLFYNQFLSLRFYILYILRDAVLNLPFQDCFSNQHYLSNFLFEVVAVYHVRLAWIEMVHEIALWGLHNTQGFALSF